MLRVEESLGAWEGCFASGCVTKKRVDPRSGRNDLHNYVAVHLPFT